MSFWAFAAVLRKSLGFCQPCSDLFFFSLEIESSTPFDYYRLGDNLYSVNRI